MPDHQPTAADPAAEHRGVGPSTDAAVEQRVAALLDRLVERGLQAGLPPVPEALERARKDLGEDTFRVLVVGEAKRGKSTFVNALIGEEYLPTDVDIATSEVFRVSNADRQEFRLRFEDGTSAPITRDDLLRYGSELAEQSSDTPPLRWIEVDTPARYIPARVALLDTPGLGALYAAHAQVTGRFIPYADSTILVLDSGQPLGTAELDLLERILEITTRIFFVQTKIDQHDREDWQAVRDRNEAILAERFPERLPSPKVWPFSARNLLRALSSPAPDALVTVSRYEAFAGAFAAFVDDTCVTPRAATALASAAGYYHTGLQLLNARERNLADADPSDSAAYRDEVRARLHSYEKQWGKDGAERRRLEQEIRKVLMRAKQALREALGPAGTVARTIEQRIESVTKVDEANQLGEQLLAETTEAALAEWRRISELAQQQCAELVRPFLAAGEELIPADGTTELELAPRGSHFRPTRDPKFDRMRGSWGNFMPLYFASSFALHFVIGPLALIALGGGALWAVHRGWKDTGLNKLTAAKNELHRYLRTILQELTTHIFGIDLEQGVDSRADAHFGELEASFISAVDAVATGRIGEVRSELAELERQAGLQSDDRDATLAEVRDAMMEWRALGAEFATLLTEMQPHADVLADAATLFAPQAPGVSA